MLSPSSLLAVSLLALPGLGWSEAFQDISEVTPPPWSSYRLPHHLWPSKYRIFTHPNITTMTFKGRTIMYLAVSEATDAIIFHAKDLSFSNQSVTVRRLERGNEWRQAVDIDIKRQLSMKEYQMHYIQLVETLPRGARISVNIRYTGAIKTHFNLGGLFLEEYKVGNETRNTFIGTVDPRYAFPCLDEPEYKALFIIKIVREGRYNSKSNAALKSTRTASERCEDCYLDEFETSPLMSPDFVGISVDDYKNISRYSDLGVLVSVWAPEDKLPQYENALDKTVRLLDHFDVMLGRDDSLNQTARLILDPFDIILGMDNRYPIRKLDVVMTDISPIAGYEHWGLILLNAPYVCELPTWTQYDRHAMLQLIAHELAHQWFGNLVTPKWRNHVWLAEGTATYLGHVAAKMIDDTYVPDAWFLENWLFLMENDVWLPQKSLDQTVITPDDMYTQDMHIVYSKGALLIKMVADYYGEQAMMNGFKRFISQYRYSTVTPEDFWTVFQEVNGLSDPVWQDLRTWEEHAGIPVITMTRNADDVISIGQHQLLMHTYDDTPTPDHYYKFPFALMYGPPTVPLEYILRGNTSTVTAERNYIKGNARALGLYRVNYGTTDWWRLGRQLVHNFEMFTFAERTTMIDDAFTLARIGSVEYYAAFNLLAYVTDEQHPYVWRVVLSHLKYIEDMLALEAEFDHIHSYTKTFADMTLDKIGREPSSNDSYNLQSLRPALLNAAKPVASDHLAQVQTKFVEWKRDTTVLEDFDLRYITGLFLYTHRQPTGFTYDQLRQTFPGLLLNGNLTRNMAEQNFFCDYQWRLNQMGSVKYYLHNAGRAPEGV